MSLGDPMPFARGDTYFGGDTTLASTNAGINLEGKTAIVKDSTTGRETELVCLRNMGSALTEPGRGAKAVSGFVGRRVSGLVDSIGAFGIMVDPAYGTTPIAQYDLFWGIKSGFVEGGQVDGTGIAIGMPATGTQAANSRLAAQRLLVLVTSVAASPRLLPTVQLVRL